VNISQSNKKTCPRQIFILFTITIVKLDKAILISNVISNNVRMLPKVRAGGSGNGQVAPLNITNERVYQDSPLMSIDRPTFAAAHLPLRKRSCPEEIIVFNENITKIIKSRTATSPSLPFFARNVHWHL